jgi:hypothetical protein
VSKLKHPFQKKKLSLERDRRPVRPDGAGPKPDPEDKIRVERTYRHEVRQALHLESTRVDEDEALALDLEARNVPRERVPKAPALPLVDALAVKKKRRDSRAGRHKARRAKSSR